MDYIRARLKEAEESIEDARLLLENDRLKAAVNRLYYACFYAVEALLWTEDLSSSKHSGVRSLFERHWIHAGRLPKEMGRFYHQLFDWRQQADYKGTLFTHEKVAAWHQEVVAFVARISEEAREKLPIQTSEQDPGA